MATEPALPTQHAPAPALDRERWPREAYDHDQCAERVLMLGTGMLLRALVATSVDDANRAGTFRGSIVAVQSTPRGHARELNRQSGLFTLVERGYELGTPVDRTRMVGSISRALVADEQWTSVRDLAARPELQMIVSNVTEAGFRVDKQDGAELDAASAPTSFAAKLADLLHTRFQRSPSAPPLFVIPTELVPDNGPRLREMVDEVTTVRRLGETFRTWTRDNVRFCSSLVDRITTGLPAADECETLSSRLGYTDALATVTEPHALWAIESEPAALHASFPIDDGQRVIFARDIAPYRDRKLRLLNGAHTAFAPIALLARVPTVRAATEHAQLAPLFRHLLFGELVPGSGIARFDADAFAHTVWDRFRNPWIEHEWSVIANNQSEKMRIRVVPSIIGFAQGHGGIPQGLAFALAAHLRLLGAQPESLADDALWGTALTSVPGFVERTTYWLGVINRIGMTGAVDAWWDVARETAVTT